MAIVTAARPLLKIAFSAAPAEVFDIGVPVLAGETVETLFRPARAAGRSGPFALVETGEWLVGCASVPIDVGLEAATHSLYADMFAAAHDRRFARIWNHVPAINECDAEGMENYQAFCRGRSLAFEHQHGTEFTTVLPSASAVGSNSAELSVVFAATRAPMRHVENPLQVSAYNYPRAYGSRAPSFARATIVHGLEQTTLFVSGTAAIRGHATVAPHDTRRQLDCMLENLRELSAVCGFGPQLDAGMGGTRHFRVYFRHYEDQTAVAAALEERLFQRHDHVAYLHADICRAPLNVEIETTLCSPLLA